MTKYILHGGYLVRENSLNKNFFSEISKNLNDDDKVLMCCFAPSEQSGLSEEEKFKRGKEVFEKNITDKNLEYVFASHEDFIKQLKEADALYLHGGMTDGLHDYLKDYPEFVQEAKKKKLVIGSSAGAYVLAEYSIDYADKSKAEKRFGFLPIKIHCHFEDKNKKALEEKFKKVDPENKYKTLYLRDCETKSY